MADLFARKPLNRLMGEAQEVGEHTLKRSLGPTNLVMLGIGAIIGAGLFVRTAAAIADRAGPSVVLAFVVAGVGCAFAGLCYAEFASMIPVAGSAYTYSYATMGEFVAWIIGWDLILEYAVGAATVSIAWSAYFNRVLDWFGCRIPYEWSHSPFDTAAATGVHGIMNIPAVFILLLLSLLLIRGTKESAFVNGIIVVLKVSIVLLVIGIGWGYVNPANHTPFIPAPTTYVTPQGIHHAYGGILGILGAAGVVFFAYIGFDAVSTAAQEARNPRRYADWYSRLIIHLHHFIRAVFLRAQRRRNSPGFSHRRARSLGCVCHHEIHDRVRMAVEVGDGGDPAGFSSVILVM